MTEWLLTKTPLMFLAQSIWRDEAFSYLMARQPFFSIFSSTAQDFNPPLYYLLLNIYMMIFGHSEIALRIFSLIFFNIMIYTVYLIIEKVYKKKTPARWVYLLLFAVSPFLLYYGLEARMYAMAAALATLSWYFLLTARPRKYLLTIILGLYTHYFFVFIVAAQLAYKMLSKSYTKEQKKAFVRHLVPAGIAFGLWVIFLLIHRPPADQPFWIVPPSLGTILNTPAILLTGYEDSFNFPRFSLVPYTLLFILTVLFGYKHAIRTKHDRDILLFLSCWTFIPVLITFLLLPIKALFLPRYLMISAPGLLLLVLFLITHMRLRTLRVAFLALFFIAFTSYHVLQINHRQKANFRGTMREIKAMAGPEDVVYVDNELNFHPAQFYFPPERVYIIGKPYQEIPYYVGKILIPQDRMVTQPPRFPKKAFIIHSDLSYDIQSIF